MAIINKMYKSIVIGLGIVIGPGIVIGHGIVIGPPIMDIII